MDEFLKNLLEVLTRIADAADSIAKASATSALAAKAPAEKPAPTKKPEEAAAKVEEPVKETPKAPTHTIEAVRAGLKEYRAIEGAPAMLEILKTHGGGVQELTAVEPKYYDAIMEAIAN